MIRADFPRFKTDFPWSTDFVKPFSEPPRFDAREVAELIVSRHRVILDELELLQTDPQYVQMLSKEIYVACAGYDALARLIDEDIEVLSAVSNPRRREELEQEK
ncbi:hypothetical protein E4T52_17526 [Aureobasidium sp. EXF-3400]|nr:hypothetical protein E4T52_17526 [Aureobasidium sp. EXF-3400]